MRDLFLLAFLATFALVGLRRPFLFVLAYAYVDIVSPQRLSYFLLNSIPVSLIFCGLAMLGWLLTDDKRDLRISGRQILLLMLLGWAGLTTLRADFPLEALEKWGWVWKSLAFAIFLPLTLRTKLRIEALLLFMVLGAASIIIVGGIKTLASGGGYGTLALPVTENAGLYEGSTISAVAITIVPIILFLSRFGTIYPPDWRVKSFAYALIFACLLMPIGTETRTGLVCILVLGVLLLREVKRRMLYLTIVGVLGLVVMPLVPSTFSQRMETIQAYQTDDSASTRVAVWEWTWNYVQDHPLGGGFNSFLANSFSFQRMGVDETGRPTMTTVTDKGRAFHSAYFEMLGEQGFPGFLVWALIHISGLISMERIRRRYRTAAAPDDWIAPLATALQHAHIIYLVGSLFIGIAYQPFVFMLLACQIALAGRALGQRAGPVIPWSTRPQHGRA